MEDNGDDIAGGKCTWLAAHALARCQDESQREALCKELTSQPRNDQDLKTKIENVNNFYTQLGMKKAFEEYEKDQSFFINDVKMSDYDKSCNAYYEDSAGTSGEFNKEAYLEREYLYKVRRTEHIYILDWIAKDCERSLAQD